MQESKNEHTRDSVKKKVRNMQEKDQATLEWLNSQKKGTKWTYKAFWEKFLEFTGLTGEAILADRKQDKEYTWEKKVLTFKDWLIREKGYADYTATAATMAVRGFFAYHRVTLQFRRKEGARLGERVRKSEDYRFIREDLQKMCAMANLKEQYVITAGKSFGLRAGDFVKLTRGDLEPYLNREPPISIGEFSTEKESVKAYPFIDTDALPVIRLMIEQMTREGKTKPTDRMLNYRYGRELTRVLKRLAKKAGINTGNKQVRFHCLRKFLIDRLASVMSESKWKMIVGKVIPEQAYVSPDDLRDDYKRAMRETCFVKAETENVELLAKSQALKMIAKMQGITEEQMRDIFKMRKAGTVEAEVEALENELTKKKEKEKDCPDCEFKEISEQELLSYLQENWQIEYKLSNGHVIVKR